MATMSRQMLRRDYSGQERVVRQEEVKITRWQLIAEKVRDAHTAISISDRCIRVYQAIQLLDEEELKNLAITHEDMKMIEESYRSFKFFELDIRLVHAPPGKMRMEDGTVYRVCSSPRDSVENVHEAFKHRLETERTLGKVIRAIVKHAESLGIKVTSIPVEIPGPGGAVFGRTRMVGTPSEEQENRRR